jgi:RNA polymerase sigma factor (sigma-70 family)
MINITKGVIVTEVDSIIKYINEIKSIPILTKEEEFEICQKIKSGDKEAISKLVKHNLRFVIHTAKKYQNLGLTFEDLISFGNLGLYRAVEKFDPDRGFKFITFAVWYIKSEITNALNELSTQVRIPNSQNSDDYNFKPEDNSLSTNDISRFDKSDLMTELKMVLNCLSDEEYDYITRFYGFGHDFAQSIDDIAEFKGLSNERIRQVIRRSERKLKNHPNLDMLRKYLD